MLPESNQLQFDIAAAQNHLYDSLLKIEPKLLNISDYNTSYLEGKISYIRNELDVLGRLLYLVLAGSQHTLNDFVLVDYGGGSGIISFLAAELGVGTVIYNDIYEVSCKDTKVLSDELGLTLDHIVCGDTSELISYLQQKKIYINAVISYDVLEHIYDPATHFKQLGRLQQNPFRIAYASGANIKNFRTARSLQKRQKKVENKNRKAKWGHKKRDSLRAYVEIRQDIISEYAPELSCETVKQLAHSTRGLIRQDIEKCVDEFCQYGKISYHINHPTNTCDPNTGNWCEHLIDLQWLEQVVKDAGFSVKIIPGPYCAEGILLKKKSKSFLNVIMHFFGKKCLFLASYYILYAELDGSNEQMSPSRQALI
ncbi:MAG: hypothetical protein SD837_05750 [Candidatus Electrothrix scaldis]|nr:MAG: hypothetical protein SD837_05750 [Candidatus Electrothrix sp. GW3-3]